MKAPEQFLAMAPRTKTDENIGILIGGQLFSVFVAL